MFSPLEPAYLSTARRLAWRPSPSSASPLVGEGRGVGSSVEVTIPYRLRMLVPSTSPSLPYFRTGLYEQDLTDQLAKQIKPGQNIVDLGANTGYYTLVASKLVGSSGRVYAFEPDPAMFGYLTRNIALNACENVTAVQQAVSDRVGSASFIRQEQERG